MRQCCPIMLPRWCVHCTGLTPVHAVASRRIVSWDLDVDQRAWVVTYNRKTFGESAKITSLTLMPPDTTSHIGGGDNLVMVSSLVVASVALPTLTWASCVGCCAGKCGRHQVTPRAHPGPSVANPVANTVVVEACACFVQPVHHPEAFPNRYADYGCRSTASGSGTDACVTLSPRLQGAMCCVAAPMGWYTCGICVQARHRTRHSRCRFKECRLASHALVRGRNHVLRR